MSSEKTVLAIDLGTTGNRVIAFSHTGDILAESYKEFPLSTPKPAWVEQNPKDIWSTTLSVLKDVVQKVSAESIVSVGITNQRETTIIWDKQTGKPVYPAIVWQCRRTSDTCKKLKHASQQVKDKTGLFLDPYFSATKIQWILDHDPNNRKRAERGELLFGTVDTWILWNLTKGKIHATDVSNASRTMLFNIHTLNYDDDLCHLFKVPQIMLPKVCDTDVTFGHIDTGFLGREIPIQALIGDQQAALFCQCGENTQHVKNTYGTGLFVMANTGNKLPKTNHLINTVAWKRNKTISYALEGSIFIGGSAIQWLRDELKFVTHAKESQERAESLTSNEEVYFVPALSGLGAPYWDPEARGLIIGLTRGTTQAHIIRATLESLAYQTEDVIAEIKRALPTLNLKVLKVDGGATSNPFLMQFQSNISQLLIEKPVVTETTAYGAAGIAGIAAGFWTEQTYRSTLKTFQIYKPNSEKNKFKDYYKKWQEAVKRSREWAVS